MKKTGWNTIVFLGVLAFYAVHYFLFWNVSNARVLYLESTVYGSIFIDFWWYVLNVSPIINTVCQIIALFQKRWIGIVWIFLCAVAWLAAFVFTYGMGV